MWYYKTYSKQDLRNVFKSSPDKGFRGLKTPISAYFTPLTPQAGGMRKSGKFETCEHPNKCG